MRCSLHDGHSGTANRENQGFMLVDQSLTEVPTACCFVKTPIFSGEVEALCLSTPMYDLVIGNIEGLHPPCPIDRENSPQVEANVIVEKVGINDYLVKIGDNHRLLSSIDRR